MKSELKRSLLTLAGLALGYSAGAWADDLRFSDMERRFAPQDRRAGAVTHVEKAGFLSDQATGGQPPLEMRSRSADAGWEGRDNVACDCGNTSCEKCQGCVNGCDASCDPSLSGVYYADVQLFFMRTHMLESAIGKLSEKYELSPRFIIGYESAGGVGARARYWTYGRGTANLDGGDAIRFEMDVLDLESTCRFRNGRTDLVLAGGLRWSDIDVTVGDRAVHNQMPGITFAADLRTAMCRDGCREWAAVGGARWSTSGGDWEGDNGGFVEPVRDDNIVVQELYGGVEYACSYRDYDLFARLIFEAQNWHSDAASQDAGTDSVGFIGPGIEVGMLF